MKLLFYSFIIIFIFSPLKTLLSQAPAYNLHIRNQVIANPSNSMDFDIYVEHTNSPVMFEYAGGQYFIQFDSAIGNGGPFSLSILDSDLPLQLRPRNPSIAEVLNPPATIMRLAVNVFPGAGFGHKVKGSGDVGTLIARVRLTLLTGKFNCHAADFSLEWRNPPVIFFSTKLFAYFDGLNNDITTPETHFPKPGPGLIPPCTNLYLKVHMLIEGSYVVSTNTLNRKEIITAFLRERAPPYILRDTAVASLDSISGQALFVFNKAISGNYYVQFKHFNSIETWTKVSLNLQEQSLPPDTLLPAEYNFTLSDTTAYGNNLILKGTKYCFYSGDVTQDGFIDGTDMLPVDNDANNFLTGSYLITDLNGDDIVDGDDLLICDNNAFAYITSVFP
ncbi:MAG: hypothetical protein ABIY50_00425 [Ignavibacteria bacterium]